MKDIRTYYQEAIESSPNPIVLEIGMGQGEDTGWLFQVLVDSGKPYRYIGFEPEPKNLAAISRLPIAKDIYVVAAAVGDRATRVPFYSSGDWPYSGSVKEPKLHCEARPDIKFSQDFMVEMVPLDLFQDILHADFIWCDVQGAEDLVIAGGQQTLARTRYFYTEHCERELYAGQIGLAEIHRRLPGHWELVQDWGNDVLFHNKDLP